MNSMWVEIYISTPDIENMGSSIASEEQWTDAVEFLAKAIQRIDQLLIPTVEQYYH